MGIMSCPDVARPDLPEYMTWEELEQLPEDIAARIELWEGRVVWLRRGPGEHQEFTNLLWSGLRRCARKQMSDDPEHCWSVRTETNVLFGKSGNSDFVTPDFMIHRCLEQAYQHVRSAQRRFRMRFEPTWSKLTWIEVLSDDVTAGVRAPTRSVERQVRVDGHRGVGLIRVYARIDSRGRRSCPSRRD